MFEVPTSSARAQATSLDLPSSVLCTIRFLCFFPCSFGGLRVIQPPIGSYRPDWIQSRAGLKIEDPPGRISQGS